MKTKIIGAEQKNPCKHRVYTDSLIYLYGILLDLLESNMC